MKRETPQRLADIIDAIEKIQRYTPSGQAALAQDEMRQAAMLRLTGIVGEAARHVGETVRQARPEVPWRAITGMRQRVVRSSLEVDAQVLWDFVTIEIPKLLPQIRAILAAM